MISIDIMSLYFHLASLHVCESYYKPWKNTRDFAHQLGSQLGGCTGCLSPVASTWLFQVALLVGRGFGGVRIPAFYVYIYILYIFPCKFKLQRNIYMSVPPENQWGIYIYIYTDACIQMHVYTCMCVWGYYDGCFPRFLKPTIGRFLMGHNSNQQIQQLIGHTSIWNMTINRKKMLVSYPIFRLNAVRLLFPIV